MTYYSTIAGVVAGLDVNSGQARRVVYEHAWNLLIADLNRRNPRCTEAEIARERATLAEAIRKVEAETVLREQEDPHCATQPARIVRERGQKTKTSTLWFPWRKKQDFTPSLMKAYYYDKIAGVVAELENNNKRARRAVYKRARVMLLSNLTNHIPQRTEAEIERERLTLEEAIRQVEAETSGQAASYMRGLKKREREKQKTQKKNDNRTETVAARDRQSLYRKLLPVHAYHFAAGVISGFGKTSSAAYRRARARLLAQFKRSPHPHPETEFKRERLILEKIVSQIEAPADLRQDDSRFNGYAHRTSNESSIKAACGPPTEAAAKPHRRSLRLTPFLMGAYYHLADVIAGVVNTCRAACGHAWARSLGRLHRFTPSVSDAETKMGRQTVANMIRQIEGQADLRLGDTRFNGSVRLASDEQSFRIADAEPDEKEVASADCWELLKLAPPSSEQNERIDAPERDVEQNASFDDPGTGDQTETQSNPAGAGTSVPPRLQAMLQAARYQGVELDLNEFRQAPGESTPSAAALSQWAQDAGMWSRAVRIRWRHLLRLNDSGPVVLLFTDGTAGLLTGADEGQKVVYLKDPCALTTAAPVAVDELRLSQVWAGEAVLVRATRGYSSVDAPFNFRWLVDLVLCERHSLRDIGLASLTISFLTIGPPMLVMMMVNKVLQFHSVSTLTLLSVMMVIFVAYETLLGHARRLIIAVISARLDAKLNLHLFHRLLRLPLDYFERHPAGETMYQIAQIYRVRDFLTGRLLTTFLDLITLCVLLPFLFYLNATLAWIVLICAAAITLTILAFLKPLRVLYSRVTAAETWKSAALGETIVGIKTVKALALEPQRRALWDERIAEAGKWRLAFGKLANWPQTVVTPIQRLMVYGTMLLGAYMAMNDPSGYMVGSLFAFLLLSQRVAQPLVGLARLVEDYEEVGAAISEAGSVLNRPVETATGAVGLRPKFAGAISFQDVSFTYTGTKLPALDRVSFSIPAGTMLGIVGRSGSGKSTITRLLQGINRDYSGFLKVDSADLREVDLRHLRQSLGVVLQNNFLFRGSIRDNIIAGRPGLTLTDAVRAARLAGAEEFIERMPNGYETYIEEGSPNLSGGQAQRLAIARALIHDPRILILDEATSALDPESEAVVSANLARIARGRTMILVSHRLSSLIECDQILVMEAGKVDDFAPHSVLLDRCPLYSQLWAQQNRHLDSTNPRHPVVAPRLVTGG